MDGFKTEAAHVVVDQTKQQNTKEFSKKIVSESEKEVQELKKSDLEKLAKKLDTSTSSASIQFNIENDNGRTVIEIKDKESGEVIRTIPNEQALKIAQNIDDFIEINNEKGLAVDDTF